VLLIVILIVLIWIAILALLIKLDIGGFGSGVLRPILKDVPVINKILPEPTEAEEYAGEFDNLPDALAEIERLNKQIDELKAEIAKGGEGESEEIKALKEEIVRLRTFEESQVEFQKLKTEFYEEVVFSDKAPEIEQYKAYYEEIDPDNAEYLYKQVVAQIETDKIMDEYIKGYTEMKPKQAAAIFDEMGDNLDLVAKILGNMEPSARAKILQAMDKDLASKLTKIMDPD
jgi:flagellar motility protein MotE (MotC chaperone)